MAADQENQSLQGTLKPKQTDGWKGKELSRESLRNAAEPITIPLSNDGQSVYEDSRYLRVRFGEDHFRSYTVHLQFLERLNGEERIVSAYTQSLQKDEALRVNTLLAMAPGEYKGALPSKEDRTLLFVDTCEKRLLQEVRDITDKYETYSGRDFRNKESFLAGLTAEREKINACLGVYIGKKGLIIQNIIDSNVYTIGYTSPERFFRKEDLMLCTYGSKKNEFGFSEDGPTDYLKAAYGIAELFGSDEYEDDEQFRSPQSYLPLDKITFE